jgi:carbon monoxide dehydrogenase subunit G
LKFEGSYQLNAKVVDVWKNLNDPEVLKNCIDGCTEFQETKYNEFKTKIIIKLGPVNATFNSIINISNVIHQKSYTIEAKGNAGSLGLASGKVDIMLEDNKELTTLNYTANSKINGKLAQLGSRLIDGSVRKNTEIFFRNFENILNNVNYKKVDLLDKSSTKIKLKKIHYLLVFIFIAILVLSLGFYD